MALNGMVIVALFGTPDWSFHSMAFELPWNEFHTKMTWNKIVNHACQTSTNSLKAFSYGNFHDVVEFGNSFIFRSYVW